MKIIHFIFLFLPLLQISSFSPEVGDVIDSYNSVPVYFNGSPHNVFGRNVDASGYNLGLRYQCVEFVKRYYYTCLDHAMPNSYGHAKDFFDKTLPDRGYNSERALLQFRNTRTYHPLENDIIIYDGNKRNPYGHMSIVTDVGTDYVKTIQQNMGIDTRDRIKLVEFEGVITLADYDIVGWLRMPY